MLPHFIKPLKVFSLIFFTLVGVYSLRAQTSSNTCADADLATSITSPGTFNVATIDGNGIPSVNCGSMSSTGVTAVEWYKYIPTSDFWVVIESSDLDTRLRVYSGSCVSLTCVDGDDNGGPGVGSKVAFNALFGQTYYILWDNKNIVSEPEENDGFDFTLTEQAPIPVHFTVDFISTGTNSGRGAVDMNGDDLDDIVAVTSNNVHVKYQQANGSFSSADYSISGSYSAAWSLSAGDYDANGFNDLVYGNNSGAQIVQANGTGTGYSVSVTRGDLFTQRTNFVDINNDGNLDVFVCDDQAPNEYFINDGNNNLINYEGAIYDNSCNLLSTDQVGAPGGLGIYCSGGNYGSVWIDYDNDNDIDLFLAKCGGVGDRDLNQLFRNNGNGTYTEVAAAAGMADHMQTWSSAWADYDNDGDMDCWVGASTGSHKMMRNNGDGTFTNTTSSTGLSDFTVTGIEHAPYDFNNDGWIDIISNGHILFNNSDGTFSAYYNELGNSHGAVGDLNNDGFLDVYRSSIYYNTGNSNNWIKLVTEGTQSNKNGIGARVEITSPLGTQIRDVRSGEGFRYMSSLNTHFGIGADTSITSLTIYWPSGTVDTVLNPSINSTLTITEGETLSLQQSIEEDLIIYPNPTKGVLNLNAHYGFENAVYSVFDLMGKRVLNSSFHSNKINVAELSAGIYILRIINEGRTHSQKFIKQ